jgi:hypothetical protein
MKGEAGKLEIVDAAGVFQTVWKIQEKQFQPPAKSDSVSLCFCSADYPF